VAEIVLSDLDKIIENIIQEADSKKHRMNLNNTNIKFMVKNKRIAQNFVLKE